MLCYDRIYVSEGFDVNKQVHHVLFVTIGIRDSSFNHLSAFRVMLYSWCLLTLTVLLDKILTILIIVVLSLELAKVKTKMY